MTQDSNADVHEHSLDKSNEPGEFQGDSTSNEDVMQECVGSESSESSENSEEMNEIDIVRRQAAENHDQYVRIAAELENYRKRAGRDVENARLYGAERLVQMLLPIRDSLEAGVAVEQADIEVLLEGKKATLRLLDAAFEQFGIQEIDPEAEPFDPNKHEAITLASSDTVEPDTVLTVVQKGYVMHDRLLRPARVIVSKEPDGP
jgi:molecular chaperone GrpE